MRQISVSLFLFLFVQVAHGKSFQRQNVSSNTVRLNKKITAQYNKNLKVNEFVQSKVDVEGPFLKDFKTHLKTTKIKNLWKAQLIGDTVYFKKKNSQLKLKLIDIKNVYQISMRVNGKEISLNFKDGFTKNYALLKSTIAVKDVSLWDSILDTVIPKLYADSIMTPPEELDEELSSALGWSSWALSIVKDESKVEKEKICNLNEKEKSNYTPTVNPEIMLEEIKYFIQVQNKYVKPMIQNDRGYVSTGGTECLEKCQWAKEFEGCLTDMASRRKDTISSNEIYGFSCFKKYEDGGIYLNSNILNQTSLESYEESYEAQIKAIEQDRKYKCGIQIHDSDRALCEKRLASRLSELKANCPPDERSIVQPSSRSRSNNNTDK